MKPEHQTVGVQFVVKGELAQVLLLRSARSSNISAAIALIFILPLALAASGTALSILLQGLTSLWAVIGEVAVIALAFGLDWVVYRIFREVFPGRCYLALTASSLVLRHPVLLRGPLVIPLADVDRVAVSTPTSPGLWEPHDFALQKEGRGLRWVASDQETIEALDVVTRFFLPLASHVQADEPNVAVVMAKPIDLGEVRRRPISSRGVYVRRLSEVERTFGFLARVKDPDAAARVFEERGLLGKLAGEQDSLIDPSEDDARRFRRWRVRGWVARVISVLIFARLVWWFMDSLAR